MNTEPDPETAALAVQSSENAGALANVQDIIGAANPIASDKAFKALSVTADYFGRLQLCGSNSTLFKQKKIPCAHWAHVLTKEKFHDLGLTCDVLPIMWRPLALDMSGGEMPISFYNETSPEFKEVQQRAETANSECTWGPQFLVWIPAIQVFATLHFGSKTARGESGKAREFLGKPGVPARPFTLFHTVITKGKYTWEGPVINPCSTPFALPDADELKAKMAKFTAEASAKGPEKADAPAAGTRPR